MGPGPSFLRRLALALALAAGAVVLHAQAPDALSTAHALHLRLLQTPVAQRRAADYEAIVAVLAPLWQDDKSSAADSARFEAGSLYVAEARDLHIASAYAKAAGIFEELLRTSPYTAYRRNAEFALAQIEIFHLHEHTAAAPWLRDFDRRYPADPRAAVAHSEARGVTVPEPEYLDGPAGLTAVPATAPPSPVLPEPADPAPADPPPATPAPLHLTVGIGNISGIQVYSSVTATSIVIVLKREAAFTRGAVAERHLVYFDVSTRGAATASTDRTEVLDVEDSRVSSVRVAANREGATRVVITTRSTADHADRGYFFPNPARLIVGVTGGSRKDPKPAEPAAIVRPAQPAQPLANGRDSLTRALGLKIGRVVLDAGHGGHDTGTISAGGLDEKDVVLDVTLRLGRLLRQRLGLAVVYTRRDDTFIPLEERTAIANRAHADLFVSIHANSNPDPDARGIETYFLDLTNSAQAEAVASRENAGSDHSIHELNNMVRAITLNDKMEESHELARDLERGLVRTTGEENRGVRSAPFVVLIGAQMPSVLAEISFLSNAQNAHQLRLSTYRQRLAEGLYQGLRNYIQSLGGPRTASLQP